MSKSVCILGVPMDLGQNRRGVDMGPPAVRYAGLRKRLHKLGCEIQECGNVEIPERDALPGGDGLSYLRAVVAACVNVYELGARTIEAGDVPIFLGGDHSIAIGTVGGVSHQQRTGLLWIDAHADFNTPETSPSGNIHGMPLAVLTGRGIQELIDVGRPGAKVRPSDVALIGVRDLDPEERSELRASGMAVYTMREIDERGIGAVAREAMLRLSHIERVHVSLDMDALDPTVAPGVGTPVAGGLSYREAHLLMEIIAESALVRSLDVVEINPILDTRNRTAELAIELILSVLGKTIL